MLLAGIDLAWNPDKNTTAISIGDCDGNIISLSKIFPAVHGLDAIKSVLNSESGLSGVAIDASLIVTNESGQRECERLIGEQYGSRGASCHSTNTKRINEASRMLSSYLSYKGFTHGRSDSSGKFQIECYPHPALIEIFELNERLCYKKGSVQQKKDGQKDLARRLNLLQNSDVIKLDIRENCSHYFNPTHIQSLAGHGLKVNEDVLDSVVCLYTCALYSMGLPCIFGSLSEGYIYVPQQKCV
ncbi:hypothetical protein DGWBC_0626 [Dehalogenimonas sp. WBC-2]|nr:hypothetical protein DGWBC_0626 [Dehalogenimonas sp. WBC-2]